jgi:Gpi18-like mannosyltransferase/putative flippase GtrA
MCGITSVEEANTVFTRVKSATSTIDLATIAGVGLITLLALAIRVPFLGHESGDYVQYVSPWYDHIRAIGLANAMGSDFSNYTPPYLYFLAVAVVAPLPKLIAIKAVSIVFDVCLAASVGLLVASCAGHKRAIAAYLLVLAAPTVVLNSAAWAQCDALYAIFVMLAVVLLGRERPTWAVLCTGVALAIKLQAVFILPLLVLFTLRRRLPIRAWALLPLPYVVAILPSWAFGRSLSSLLLIYKNQSDTYQQLSLDGPSFYAWVTGREDFGPYAAGIGIAIVGFVVVTAWRARVPLTRAMTVKLATMFTLLVPFVLPRMHERYFFLADVFAVAYAVLTPRRWFIPVLVITASTLSYLPFLYGTKLVPISWLSLLMLAALLTTLYDVFEQAVRRSTRSGRWRAVASASARWIWFGSPLPDAASRLLSFALIGLVCTGAYAALYVVLRDSLSAVRANALSLLVTMTLNFVANREWTFRTRRGRLSREVIGYVLVYAIGLGASTVTLALALDITGHPSRPFELCLAIGASGTATIVRFVVLNLTVYRSATVAPPNGMLPPHSQGTLPSERLRTDVRPATTSFPERAPSGTAGDATRVEQGRRPVPRA